MDVKVGGGPGGGRLTVSASRGTARRSGLRRWILTKARRSEHRY